METAERRKKKARRLSYWKRGAALLIVLSLAVGCQSQIPSVEHFDRSSQRKMQSAQHWDVLAQETAKLVSDTIIEKSEARNIPIFVKRPTDSAFSLGFYDLLKSRLVEKELPLSVTQEDALILEYRVMLVRNSDRYQRPPPGMLTALPLGVLAVHTAFASAAPWALWAAAAGVGLAADVGVGMIGDESNREVIITTALTYNNRYLMHTSSTYYINDPDWRQFAVPGTGPRISRESADAVWEKYVRRQPTSAP